MIEIKASDAVCDGGVVAVAAAAAAVTPSSCDQQSREERQSRCLQFSPLHYSPGVYLAAAKTVLASMGSPPVVGNIRVGAANRVLTTGSSHALWG